ncbi:MAG TPA: hypothetical protein VF692_14770 [Pyrinomonadaceae bacterium]
MKHKYRLTQTHRELPPKAIAETGDLYSPRRVLSWFFQYLDADFQVKFND